MYQCKQGLGFQSESTLWKALWYRIEWMSGIDVPV